MKSLTRFVAFLVLFIACVGFTLSYRALYEYGLSNGVNPDLAWLWPLIIDGFMLVISLSILRASLLQEPTLYLWGLAGTAIAVSIVFNIAHAPATLAGRAVAMIAPLAMFGSFEVFIGQVKRSAERNQMQESYAVLQVNTTKAQTEYEDWQARIKEAEEIVAALQETAKVRKAELKEIQSVTRKAQAEYQEAQCGDTRGKLAMYFLQYPDASQEQAAQAVGVSRARIGQLLKDIRQPAAMPLNGKAHPSANGEH